MRSGTAARALAPVLALLVLVADAGAPPAPAPAEAVAPALAEETTTTPGPGFHDKLKQFFAEWKSSGHRFMVDYMLSDEAFYLSTIMVLQWHIRFHFSELIWASCKRFGFMRRQIKPMMALRRIGLNILILAIYYDKDLPDFVQGLVKNRPFISAIGLVFLDQVLIYYFFQFLALFVNPTPRKDSDWRDPVEEFEDDGFIPDKTEANNVYEDLTFRFRRLISVWLVQVFLTIFYVEELNANGDTKDIDNVDFIYWVVAVIFQIVAGDEQVGEPFNPKFWGRLIQAKWAPDKIGRRISSWRQPRASVAAEQPLMDVAAADDDDDSDPKLLESLRELGQKQHKMFTFLDTKLYYEWCMRAFMDFSVNSIARSIILYTVPIMVCVEAPLDFVKDLTAVMFITMLDNVPESKHLKEMVIKLKFGIETRENGSLTTWSLIKKVLSLGRAEAEYVHNKWGPGGPLTKDEKDFIFSQEGEARFQQLRERLEGMEPKAWQDFTGQAPQTSSTEEELCTMREQIAELIQKVAQLEKSKADGAPADDA